MQGDVQMMILNDVLWQKAVEFPICGNHGDTDLILGVWQARWLETYSILAGILGYIFMFIAFLDYLACLWVVSNWAGMDNKLNVS